MRTVLYINDSPLLLDNIERDANDAIIRAEVVNGDWVLKIDGNEMQCCDFLGTIVTRQEIVIQEEVTLEARGDYSHIISKANKLRTALTTNTTEWEAI